MLVRLHGDRRSIPTCSRIFCTHPIKICQLLPIVQLLPHSAASTNKANSSIRQMVTLWRCTRLLPRSSRLANPLPPTHVRMRLLSTCPTTIPNIATILATSPRHGGHTVTVEGSIRTVRNQKQHSFVALGDGSTAYSLKAVLDPQLADG